MDENIAVVELLEGVWSKFPKNQLWEVILPTGETMVKFACQVKEVKVLLIVIIGKRKGLREKIYALDTSRHIVLDRLLLAELTIMGDGYLLPLIEMRHKVRHEKQSPYTLCREYMERVLQGMLANPDWYASCIRKMERKGVSICAVSGGGACGLGKRQ